MGVYSGVYEYTQQIQEQIPSIQSIRVFGAFAELQAGSLQFNWFLPRSETHWKTTIVRKWIRAAQRSSAWSLALQLAGASMQNATDRTGEGSEHPSTQNPPTLGCKKGEGGNPPPSGFINGRGFPNPHPHRDMPISHWSRVTSAVV